MFPTYSEVVRVCFTQVIANHLLDEITPAETMKIHAEFLSAMNALVPNGEVIKFEYAPNMEVGVVEVKITCGDEADDFFIVGVTIDFGVNKAYTYVI